MERHNTGCRGRGQFKCTHEEGGSLFREAGYVELPVTAAHAADTEELPDHHADPFDRMLVAQALHEPFRLLTHDRQLVAYGGSVEFV